MFSRTSALTGTSISGRKKFGATAFSVAQVLVPKGTACGNHGWQSVVLEIPENPESRSDGRNTPAVALRLQFQRRLASPDCGPGLSHAIALRLRNKPGRIGQLSTSSSSQPTSMRLLVDSFPSLVGYSRSMSRSKFLTRRSINTNSSERHRRVSIAGRTVILLRRFLTSSRERLRFS